MNVGVNDPFASGCPGHDLVEDGIQLVKAMLGLQRDELLRAVFTLEEEELRSVALVLVLAEHPREPADLEAFFAAADPAPASLTERRRTNALLDRLERILSPTSEQRARPGREESGTRQHSGSSSP